jgi:hypothetical protein
MSFSRTSSFECAASIDLGLIRPRIRNSYFEKGRLGLRTERPIFIFLTIIDKDLNLI